MDYYLRLGEELALRALEAREGGPKVLILEGPPGTGKTAFAEFLAVRWGSQYLYFLCHHWVSEEELFERIHVGRVAAGVVDPAQAYEPGILTKAAGLSHQGMVVLCLDELDKAPPRVEALLLDFLQTGRVSALSGGPPVQADLDRLTVVITTNGVRPLGEPLLRRGFRLTMEFLPPQAEADIIRKRTGIPMGAIRVIVRMMNLIRAQGTSKPSLQEGIQLANDLKVAAAASEVNILIKGWLCKTPEDWGCLTASVGDPGAILLGEYRRAQVPGPKSE